MVSFLTTALGLFMFLAFCFWMFQIATAAADRSRQKALGGAWAPYPPKASVVVPMFNEVPSKLRACVESILRQVGVEVEVILVNDGSTDPNTLQALSEFESRARIIGLPKNQGKRFAQAEGFKVAQHPYIVTVDSDTCLEPEAIRHLVVTAVREDAQAVCGTVKLANASQTLWTRIARLMYWFAYWQERASQSAFGTVTCCSGAISLYVTDVVRGFLDQYVGQSFMGRTMNAGDDRFLTTLFLLDGKRVVWTPQAVGYTDSPPTLPGLLKQQLRWSRSYLATVPYLWANRRRWTLPFAYFNIRQLYRYPYHAVVLATLAMHTVVAVSLMPLFWLLLSVVFIGLCKAFVAYIYTRDASFFWLGAYAPLAMVLMAGVMAAALFTPNQTGWVTRKPDKSAP